MNAPVNAPTTTGAKDRRERPRLRIATSADGRIAELVRRYPDVSSGEKEELRRFIDSACPIEVQRLRSDARLRPLFDRAARDIRGPLYGRGEIISGIVLALLFLASCWLLWSTSRF
jgi:hypothetical protein